MSMIRLLFRVYVRKSKRSSYPKNLLIKTLNEVIHFLPDCP